jgi:DNA polymerase I
MRIKIGEVKLKGTEGDAGKTKAREAESRKKSNNETLEEAWQRIKASKKYTGGGLDQERLDEVYEAMQRGDIGREPVPEGKKQSKFSAAEAMRLWSVLEDRKKADRIKKLIEGTPANYVLVNNSLALDGLIRAIKGAELIAIDCETFGENPGDQFDPWKGEMAGFSITPDDESHHYYVPLKHTTGEQLSEDTVWGALKELMESKPNVVHNGSFDCKFFMVQYGVDLIKNLKYDTQILAWAADENASHRLKDCAELWLGLKESWTYDKLFAKGYRFNEVPLDAALVYAAGDTEKTLKLLRFIQRQFNKTPEGKRIYDWVMDVEMPVLRQFIYADLRGLQFDVKKSRELDAQFEKEETEVQQKIFAIVGREFNVASPAQLSEILFDELKLPKLSKRSTKTDVLEKLKNKHEIIPLILEYRAVAQLRKAFTKKLPNVIKSDGKIHQDHNTWGAVTSRFTCKDPNTQQMPAKRPEIRMMFSPDPGRIFIGIDYSQIELRVLAHLANEESLIEAFEKGLDIHSLTASKISGMTYEEIEANKDTQGHPANKARKNAKPVNFGIVYGLTAFGLSNQLSISEKEAQEIIDAFFESYKGIKSYMDEQISMARKKGYVVDMFGRKRRLKEKYDRGFYGGADRQAGNFPIQASAGGILKKACVDLEPLLAEHDVNIALQIHDELLFDAPETLPREVVEQIRKTMEDAIELTVPVRCDVEISPNYWMENLSLDEYYGAA